MPEVTATTLTHRTNTQVNKFTDTEYRNTKKHTNTQKVEVPEVTATTVTHRTNTHKIRHNAYIIHTHKKFTI